MSPKMKPARRLQAVYRLLVAGHITSKRDNPRVFIYAHDWDTENRPPWRELLSVDVDEDGDLILTVTDGTKRKPKDSCADTRRHVDS